MPFFVQSLEDWEQAGEPRLLSVLIPAHNEEAVIAGTVEIFVAALSAAAIPHEILVINDNSKDRTEAILCELEVRLPTLRHLNNDPPNGFGFAVRRGLAEFRGACVALVMADASDDPDDLVAFYRKWTEGYDCVFGTRFARQSKVVDYPFRKLLLNRAGNWLIKLMLWTRYNDTTNAFKLYGRNVIAGVQPFLSYQFNILAELPLKAIVRGFRYAVLPNNWYNRKAGASKFKIKELGSRYLFVIFYCLLERLLSRGDLMPRAELKRGQLQTWHR